jgi:2-keto-4-pentenoate hydratase/2-oxohepta-3-ene-1,7-dioic acid hydratase in catechol pathway
MRLCTLRVGAGRLRAGLLVHSGALPLEAALAEAQQQLPIDMDAAAGPRDPAGILALLDIWDAALPSLQAAARAAHNLAADELEPATLERLGPPIPKPGKVICVGLNYADHARETGAPIPAQPILFAKFSTCVRGPSDDVIRPLGVTDLDYEAELAIVIGRRARHVPADRALDAVAGYTVSNDVSARTVQLREGGQWVRGKSFDTFCPIGPALVTTDELRDPQTLAIRCLVDGTVRQDSTTAQMIFSVAELVSFCSRSMTLEPGDLILTGTPPGVAMARDPSPWLQPGQLCEVEIDGVGRIANRIVDEVQAEGV